MERLWAAVLLVLIGRNVDGANTENFLFKVGRGDSVTLRPPSGSDTTITGVTWRHGENIAAEWSKGEPVELYLAFKGRTDLNTATGVMVIRDMTEQQAGEYSVEINNRRLEDKYVVKAVEDPPKPNVWPKVETKEGERDLVCESNVTEKAQPVTYWWNTDGSWVKMEKKITVANNETTQRVEKFSCKIVNIAGEAASDPWDNPYFKKPSPPLGPILASVSVVGLLVGLAVLGYCKKDAIKARFSRVEATGNDTVESPGEQNPPPKVPAENVPLNTNNTT